MIEKIREWYGTNRDAFDFSYMTTTFVAIFYGVIWCVNWALVEFLNFTHLWLVLLAWISWSFGNTIGMWLESKENRPDYEEEEDEPKFL